MWATGEHSFAASTLRCSLALAGRCCVLSERSRCSVRSVQANCILAQSPRDRRRNEYESVCAISRGIIYVTARLAKDGS
jgi:hypothetical protein